MPNREAIQISVDYQHTEFTPGDTISGKLQWNPNIKTEIVRLRLIYQYRGGDAENEEVIEEVSFPPSQTIGEFSIQLPQSPYSMSGVHSELCWMLEAIGDPSQPSTQYPFVLSPNGKVIQLQPIDQPICLKKSSRFAGTVNRMDY